MKLCLQLTGSIFSGVLNLQTCTYLKSLDRRFDIDVFIYIDVHNKSWEEKDPTIGLFLRSISINGIVRSVMDPTVWDRNNSIEKVL